MHFLQNSQCDSLVAQSAHCWFWPASKLVLGKWGKHFALINDSMIGGRNLILAANFHTFKVHPDFIKITCPFFLETILACVTFLHGYHGHWRQQVCDTIDDITVLFKVSAQELFFTSQMAILTHEWEPWSNKFAVAKVIQHLLKACHILNNILFWKKY